MKLRIRKHQLKNRTGQNVTLSCTGMKASYKRGDVDSTWIDVTPYTVGLDELEFIMRSDLQSTKASEKSSTVQLSFINDASTLIMDWLYATPCSQLNYFDAEITDEVCGVVFRNFELKADNIEVCENDGCYITLPLRESDERFEAFKKLSIMDNWQKWYSEDGAKEHPTFHVAIFNTMPILQCFIVGMLVAIKNIAGFSQILEVFMDINAEIRKQIGVGRYASAPRIHTILRNLCDKVGLGMDTVFDENKELYNDCFFAPAGGHFFRHPKYTNQGSPSRKFVWGNRTVWMATEFLDEICKLYNLYWDIVGDKLVIKKKVDLINSQSFDLTDHIRGGVCYSFDNTKKPAYGRYEYAIDATDTASQHIQIAYNDIVDFDGEVDNPLLEGELSKTMRFASTGFLHDKFKDSKVDDILDSARIIAYVIVGIFLIIGGAFLPVFGVGGIVLALVAYGIPGSNNTIQNLRGELGDLSTYAGSVQLLGDGTVSVPRILRYDPSTSLASAKVVTTNVSSIAISELNTSKVSYTGQPWGTTLYAIPARMYNYPLYFDGNYKGNLFDLHATTDNPYQINLGNKQAEFKLELCCDTLKLMGLLVGDSRIVGKVAKIRTGEKILVSDATISYRDMTITIKGKIIYS